MSVALTAIISQTCNSILEKLFEQHGIDYARCLTFKELLNKTQEWPDSELTFVSRELIRSSAEPVEATISQLRNRVKGAIYVLSTSIDHKETEQFIQAGVTDVIQTSKIDQVERILKSYQIHLDTRKQEAPHTILVVEDAKSLSIMLTRVFEDMGSEVLACADAKTGLDLLNNHNVDAIVCDLVLEGNETGLEIVRQTSQSSRWRGIPLLITTSFTDVIRQKHLYRLGVRDVLQKPYDVEILALKVLAMAREHRMHELLIKERRRIEEMTFIDSETGLRNKAFVRERFEEWINLFHENAYAFLVEIDNYAEIKRQYGLNQGEFALQRVADVLRNFESGSAIIAHLTGEQFLMLVGGIDKGQAVSIAQKTINEVADRSVSELKTLSVSIGVAESHSNISLNDFLKIADSCLYIAKEDGPGSFETT